MRGMTPQTPGPAAYAVRPVDATDDGIIAHELMTEIMGTVPTFGGRRVHVGFSGTRAFCNPTLGYVNVPALPPCLVVPHSFAMELRGYAAHEAAHLIWTDEDVMENARTEEEKRDALLHETWNAIEDFLIERNFLAVYPGAHKNFGATEIRCVEEYLAAWRKNPDMAKDLRIIGPVALTWARAVYFGLQSPGSLEALKTLPPALRQRVQDWFMRIEPVACTQECLDHARVIAAEIRAQPFDPNDMPANPQAGQCQAPTQAGGRGNGAGQGGGPGQGSATGAPTPQAPAPQQPWATARDLAGAFQQAGIDPSTAPEQISYAVRSGLGHGPHADAFADPDGSARSRDIEASLGATIGTVARVLRRALQAQTQERWRGGRSDGVIDDKRLAAVVLGSSEIYKRKRRAEEIDTAVTMLIDCSSSMHGAEIAVCQQLAVVLDRAFSGTPIRFEIVGYTTEGEDHLPEHAKVMLQAVRAQDPDVEDPVRGIAMYDFKAFESMPHVAAITVGNMDKAPMGGTPTGDALLFAHHRLSRRKEARHVIFCLTDGAPDDCEACLEAVRSIQDCGCTVLGIGIGTNAVEHSFDDWVVVNDPRDISALVLARISALLFKNRTRKGRRAVRAPHRIAA